MGREGITTKEFHMRSLVAAGVALTAGATHRAIAQQSASPKVEPKDFVDKLEAVRRGIEREHNERPAPSNR